MFEKAFVKYARAISNDRERERMFRLFVAKFIALIAFYVLCFAVIIEALVFSELWENGGDGGFILFGISLLLWLISAVAALVLWLKFRSAFKSILARPTFDGELPEIASYRRKVREDGISSRRSARVPAVIFALGIVFMIAAVAVDVARHPDSEDLSGIGIAGIVVFGVTLFVFIMSLSVAQIKKSMRGAAVEMRTADEARSIDAAQGRKHEYSLAEDNPMRSLIFLFPDPELRKEAQRLSKLQVKVTLISALSLVAVSVIVIFLLFTPIIYGEYLVGYAFPTFLAILFVGVMLSVLPVVVKSGKLEKRQRAEIENNPAYEKNTRIYKLYDEHTKIKGKIIIVSLLAAIAVGFALAVAFPRAAWSLASVFIAFIGVALNNKFVADLRKKVRVIEEEITAPHTDVKFRVQAEEDELSLKTYMSVNTTYNGDSLVAENGGGNFELYLGKTNLCLNCDIESKRVAAVCGMFYLDDVPTAQLDIPVDFDMGILYFELDGTPLVGTAMNIAFDRSTAYDRQNRLLALGVRRPDEKLAKINANTYVQISDGTLDYVLLTDIGKNG